jgi:hypothetical protein
MNRSAHRVIVLGGLAVTMAMGAAAPALAAPEGNSLGAPRNPYSVNLTKPKPKPEYCSIRSMSSTIQILWNYKQHNGKNTAIKVRVYQYNKPLSGVVPLNFKNHKYALKTKTKIKIGSRFCVRFTPSTAGKVTGFLFY